MHSHSTEQIRPAEAARPTQAFEAAVEALRAAVGDEHVQVDLDTRLFWSRSTLSEGTVPRAIVRPRCTSEVQAVMRAANRHGLTVHPISTGRNWGYGDACAVTAGQIILDLKRMDRILEVNADLAYVTVEPGVTQGQIVEHLESREIPLWMDATGAGPHTSLIGNTLERGFGHTPHGDRFAHCCGLEVVLPDGRLLRTGFGHYQNAQAAEVYPYGVGPYLDGIFTQSNLGVVTRMTFWLMPKPEVFKAFVFFAEREDDLGPLVEALRPLRQRGTLRTPIHIGNDLRLVSMNQSYPWQAMNGQTPLSPKVRDELRRAHGVWAWTGTGALFGSKAEVAAAEKEVRRALANVRGMKRLVFLDDRKLRWIETAQALLERFGWGKRTAPMVAKVKTVYELLKGRSPEKCVQGGLWRVRRGAKESRIDSPNPLDHGAGFYWISPVLPMAAEHVDKVNGLAERVLNDHGFDYQVTFTLLNGRALCAVITVSFDKRNAEEAKKARACHDALLDALLAAGYPPYRAGNHSMKKLGATSTNFFDITAQLKAALDPNGVLSPGHYEPSRA